MEWVLLGIIAVMCAALSLLQYRWTGELSRAEPALLRSGLNDQLRRLAQDFNEEVRENITALLPLAGAIRELGRAEAHRVRYEQWIASHDQSFFKRIGVAVPRGGNLQLYGVDNMGRLFPAEWPAEWNTFRTGMTARLKGEGRPHTPVNSDSIEFRYSGTRTRLAGQARRLNG